MVEAIRFIQKEMTLISWVSTSLLTQSSPGSPLQTTLHGLQPARLLCPWNFPGKNTGMGCHFLLPTQGLNVSPASAALQADSFTSGPPGKTILHSAWKLHEQTLLSGNQKPSVPPYYLQHTHREVS